MLANNPSIGRKCEFIRPGLHRFEHGKHVVFYLVESDEIFIVRLQHQQMIPNKPQFE
jgi:toxin ParE1/3/4